MRSNERQQPTDRASVMHSWIQSAYVSADCLLSEAHAQVSSCCCGTPRPAAPHVRLLSFAAAALIGVFSALQNGVNTTLSSHVEHAGCGASGRTLLAALVSFATGLLALLLLNAAQLAAQRHRGEPHGLRRPQRAWEACGGLLGSSVMVLTLLALPSTGFALIAVCRSAGQISSSLALDHTGCLGGEVRLLTRRRACGAALCVGGACLSMLHELRHGLSPSAALFAALPIVAGGLLMLQAAVNGRAAKSLGHPLRATLLSFSVGVLCLAALNAGCEATAGAGDAGGARATTTLRHAPWWAFSGGVLGLLAVTANLVLPPIIGFASLASFSLAGMLAASLALDAAGAYGCEPRPPSLLRVGGAALALGGAWVVRSSSAKKGTDASGLLPDRTTRSSSAAAAAEQQQQREPPGGGAELHQAASDVARAQEEDGTRELEDRAL